MSTVGLLINPASCRKNHAGLALAEKLKHNPIVSVAILEEFAQFDAIMRRFYDLNIVDLFISAGDGTIQFLQTRLAEERRSGVPRLGLLPHGTTNMTAGDVGIRHESLAAQLDFIMTNPTNRSIIKRPTLRIVNFHNVGPQHGMFLGAGALKDAAQLAQTAFNKKGVKGNWAAFGTLIRMLTLDRSHLIKPHAMTICHNDKVLTDGPQLAVLATTLKKLVLKSRPFWGGDDGPIRLSALAYPPPALSRWFLPILYGKEDRKLPVGAISRAGKNFTISGTRDFVLDGEFFYAAEHEPLQIETGPDFTYLVG